MYCCLILVALPVLYPLGKQENETLDMRGEVRRLQGNIAYLRPNTTKNKRQKRDEIKPAKKKADLERRRQATTGSRRTE